MENDTTKSPDRSTPTTERYHSNQEIEGKPTLVSVDEDDVTVKDSEINDNSTGMHRDDFLGKSNKEEA